MRHIVLLSAMILGSTFAFSSVAQAGSTDVHFNGTVASSCTFSNVQNGTLGLDAAGTTLSSLPTSSGTSGHATLTCNNLLATLSASVPQQATAPTGYDHATAIKTVAVTGTGANVVAIVVPTVPVPVPLPGATNLTVNMTTTTVGLIPSGIYDMFVTLTVTP
ncbi:MAG: hypothetical protein V7K50_07760 [Nostoc sp.]|uniref:hypothetical protein n=1 Tax=Nostoc sp. TaxID=1180 RepID=UPI002FF50E12